MQGVLTRSDIERLRIIYYDSAEDYDERCFSNASYDLRPGKYCYTPGGEINALGPFQSCPYKKENIHHIEQCKNDVLIIKPFTSIVFSTLENIRLPNNVAGRFDLKVKWALQGLILQVGTQIEPGYHGKLFGLLHNFSKNTICIPISSRFLAAEFSFTSAITPPARNNPPLIRIEQFIDKYSVIDGTLEHYLNEIKRVNDNTSNNIDIKMAEMQATHTDILIGKRYRMTLLVTIFVAILCLGISIGVPVISTKMTYDKDDYPNERVNYLEKLNDSLKDRLTVSSDKLILIEQSSDSLQARIREIEKSLNKMKERTK